MNQIDKDIKKLLSNAVHGIAKVSIEKATKLTYRSFEIHTKPGHSLYENDGKVYAAIDEIVKEHNLDVVERRSDHCGII